MIRKIARDLPPNDSTMATIRTGHFTGNQDETKEVFVVG